MRIRYIYLTDQSRQLAQKIKSSLSKDYWFDIGLDYEKGLEAEIISYSEFKAESGTYFKESDCLVFIMASGIVVRSIASHLVDKFTDPAVLVVDELGINVISLLSGHMGGANDLCRRIASSIGANPVITTATDINNKGAFDMLVKKMWANVDNLRDLSLLINSDLLKGVDIQLYIDPDYREYFEEDDLRGFSLVDQVKDLTSVDRNIEKNIDVKIQTRYDKIVISDKLDLCRLAEEEGLVLVVPRRNVLGIGCRKNTDPKVFEGEVLSYLSQANIDVRSIDRLGSIDLKRDEICIDEFSSKYGIRCEFFAPEDLAAYHDIYDKSEFVKKVTGVYSVAQPACHILAGGRLLGEMYRDKGITLALGRRYTRFFGKEEV
ncbi:cobalt-precorrin 5A hydrolase [Peptostreptococcus sp.]